MTFLRIAMAQINTTVGDLAQNQKKILANIEQAKALEADLVLFPEMAVTGYPPEDLLLKPHFVQDSVNCLKELAATGVGHHRHRRICRL